MFSTLAFHCLFDSERLVRITAINLRGFRDPPPHIYPQCLPKSVIISLKYWKCLLTGTLEYCISLYLGLSARDRMSSSLLISSNCPLQALNVLHHTCAHWIFDGILNSLWCHKSYLQPLQISFFFCWVQREFTHSTQTVKTASSCLTPLYAVQALRKMKRNEVVSRGWF